MENAELDKAKTGIKIPVRNINNLRYVDDTTLMAESEEELKNLFMKVKEEIEKVGLKCSIQKTEIMASGSITSWQIDGETVTVRDFILGGSEITADTDCSHELKRHLLSLLHLLSFVRLCHPMGCSMPGLPVQNLLKLMSIASAMPSNHLILYWLLLLLLSIFPSIRVFSNESVLHIRWPKYWSFSFSISPSNEHPGLISFRMDW